MSKASGPVRLECDAHMEGADEPIAAAPRAMAQDEVLAKDDFDPGECSSLEINTVPAKAETMCRWCYFALGLYVLMADGVHLEDASWTYTKATTPLTREIVS